MEQPKRRRGRPPKPEHEKRRRNLTFRVRAHLRYRLELAAARDGRSLSEEIEHRLERSLNEEIRFFGIPDPEPLRRAIDMIAMVFSSLEAQTNRKAFGPDGDPWLHEQAWNALCIWFAATRPPGEARPPVRLSRNPYLRKPPPKSLINAIGHLAMMSQLTEPKELNFEEFRTVVEFLAEIRKAEKAAQPPPTPEEIKAVRDQLNSLPPPPETETFREILAELGINPEEDDR